MSDFPDNPNKTSQNPRHIKPPNVVHKNFAKLFDSLGNEILEFKQEPINTMTQSPPTTSMEEMLKRLLASNEKTQAEIKSSSAKLDLKFERNQTEIRSRLEQNQAQMEKSQAQMESRLGLIEAKLEQDKSSNKVEMQQVLENFRNQI